MPGIYTDGVTRLSGGLKGGETLPVDTNYTGGESPQTAAVTAGQAASGSVGVVAGVAAATLDVGADVNTTLITSASTLATFTVKLPASPYPGLKVGVISQAAVTALTVDGNGNTVHGAPSSLAALASTFFQFINGDWWVV